MSSKVWGEKDTEFFYDLTPDRILTAFESVTGYRATGRCFAHNSMENRVYEVEIEAEEGLKPWQKNRIVKFYRPGRWSPAQLAEEHEFMADLVADEVPVIAPEAFDHQTLFQDPETQLYFTVFAKAQGRAPYELLRDQVDQVGRLLARLHNVGAARKSHHRIKLCPETYGLSNLDYLHEAKVIPQEQWHEYRDTVLNLIERMTPMFDQVDNIRVHGDCHLGNLLWGDRGPFWVDFDDFVQGPAVQDLWLMIAGRDQEAQQLINQMIQAYRLLRDFDERELRLIEPLRALRFVHFDAWIAKRWLDPAFPKAFPDFGSIHYWQTKIIDLKEQLRVCPKIT